MVLLGAVYSLTTQDGDAMLDTLGRETGQYLTLAKHRCCLGVWCGAVQRVAAAPKCIGLYSFAY